jgi:hypothetical protein
VPRATTIATMPQIAFCPKVRIAPLLGQFVGARIGLGRLGFHKSLGGEQRQTSGQLQLDLPFVPSRTFGQCRQCRETALEMANRFHMRQARRGMSAGLQPLIDGTFGIAGAHKMMGQEFGLALDEIGKILLQHRRDPSVQLVPPSAQQHAIRGVLHEGVLEEIGGLRSGAAAKQQSGIAELVCPAPA